MAKSPFQGLLYSPEVLGGIGLLTAGLSGQNPSVAVPQLLQGMKTASMFQAMEDEEEKRKFIKDFGGTVPKEDQAFFKAYPKVYLAQKYKKTTANTKSLFKDGQEKSFDVSKDSLIGREILSFGNCFLNNLSMSQSTKGLLTSEYTYVGSNIEAQTLSSSSLEKASGLAPSMNLSGDQAQSVNCSFDAMSSYYTNSSSEIIPSYNTNISISGGGGGSLGSFLIKSDSIQSFDLNLPINRKTIYSLGKKHPVKRKALFPSAGSFSFSNLVSSLFRNILNDANNPNSAVNFRKYVKKEARVLEYGCSIAPAYRTYRRYFTDLNINLHF